MRTVALVFPHQLFSGNEAVSRADEILIIEDFLLFRQYSFHKQKLVLHRATMKRFERELKKRGKKVSYLESADLPARKSWKKKLLAMKPGTIVAYDPVDRWLESDIRSVARSLGAELELISSPMFLNSRAQNDSFFEGRKRILMRDFYEWQRTRTGILMDGNAPAGGKYSFDAENRKRIPKGYDEPKRASFSHDHIVEEAKRYVNRHFPDNPGSVETFSYATSRQQAIRAVRDFVSVRLRDFGAYEDAISKDFRIMNHSVLTPYLNIGLITPGEVIQEALAHSKKHPVPINSLEGFVRQILGWREFIRAMYERFGSRMRNGNFFKHSASLPYSFWSASTGNAILDATISRVIETGYCHHIERLMILGNYMLLSETKPDDAYRWFMELFIDAYDWVMVPNVYGMSQFADGGIFATKPYVCASNYLAKMGDYKKDGTWDKEFDDKFWKFLSKHEAFFSKNPRMKLLLSKKRAA